MPEQNQFQTRKLSDSENRAISKDLLWRSIISLISSFSVIVFALMLTIEGKHTFVNTGTTGICIAAIWIAVIAVDFGMIRNAIQSLTWRHGNHLGVLSDEKHNPPGIGEDIFNIIGAIIFIAFGIAVLIAGKLGLDSANRIPQIPLSILSISFGLSSAQSTVHHFWLRSKGYTEVIHKAK